MLIMEAESYIQNEYVTFLRKQMPGGEAPMIQYSLATALSIVYTLTRRLRPDPEYHLRET